MSPVMSHAATVTGGSTSFTHDDGSAQRRREEEAERQAKYGYLLQKIYVALDGSQEDVLDLRLLVEGESPSADEIAVVQPWVANDLEMKYLKMSFAVHVEVDNGLWLVKIRRSKVLPRR